MNLCQHCNRTFATPSSLKRHISAKHSSEADDHRQTRTTHQCPHCHEHFARNETVRRHVRSKHEGRLSTCSFCSKQFRADYMRQHKSTCARKYWQKIEQYANLDNADVAQKNNLHAQNEELSEAADRNHTLRIVYENRFDTRLAADALTEALLWFEANGDVESYKAVLITALRSNITVRIVERTRQRNDRFYRLYLIATYFDEIVRGVRQINDHNGNLGTTILHAACRAGFAEILEPLYWRGAFFDALGYSFQTPLCEAVCSGDIDTVRYALALGSDPNLEWPLGDAFDAERQDIIMLLIKHGADINQRCGDTTILSAAVRADNLGKVRLALSLGADPNVAHSMDLLIEICMWDSCDRGYDCVHEEMACLLIEHGADVSRQSPTGYTVLHYAAMQAHAQLLRTALNRINSPTILDMGDDDNNTPLHCATQAFPGSQPHQALISTSMLLEAGADPNVQNVHGHSALMLAAKRGSDELVRLLLDAGADVQTQSRSGLTALWHAAERGHSTTVRLLLEIAALTHKDSSYLTLPLEEAVKRNHRDVVKQLISFGADCSAGEVLSLALKFSTSEVVRMLGEAGARFNSVVPHSVAMLFTARDAEERFWIR